MTEQRDLYGVGGQCQCLFGPVSTESANRPLGRAPKSPLRSTCSASWSLTVVCAAANSGRVRSPPHESRGARRRHGDRPIRACECSRPWVGAAGGSWSAVEESDHGRAPPADLGDQYHEEGAGKQAPGQVGGVCRPLSWSSSDALDGWDLDDQGQQLGGVVAVAAGQRDGEGDAARVNKIPQNTLRSSRGRGTGADGVAATARSPLLTFRRNDPHVHRLRPTLFR